MTKLEAIIQPSRFDAVKDALREIGVDGMTVFEMVLPDSLVDTAVKSVLKSAKTGKIGDGKIFLTKVDEAIRIRNEERGNTAL